MITTELIKILKDNECGAITHKPREISLTINGKYMPNPQITLSSTGDGICGAEIDLDVDGKFFEEQEPCGDCITIPKAEYKARLLAEWLKELKQLREQTKWIPISEKMPEEETDVLICNSKGNIEVSRGSVFDDGTWEWYTSGWHFGEVIAWQPLPKPYKTESEK